MTTLYNWQMLLMQVSEEDPFERLLSIKLAGSRGSVYATESACSLQ